MLSSFYLISFALLRATSIAFRGDRGRWREDDELNVGQMSFNLIPRPPDD